MLRLIVVTAALAFAGQAVAQDSIPVAPKAGNQRAFELFDRYCLSTDGDIDAAAASADADGWTKSPPEIAEMLGLAQPFQVREGAPLASGGEPATLASQPPSRTASRFGRALSLRGRFWTMRRCPRWSRSA